MANFKVGITRFRKEAGRTMEQLLNIGDFVEGAHLPFLSSPMPVVWYMIRMHPNYDLKAGVEAIARSRRLGLCPEGTTDHQRRLEPAHCEDGSDLSRRAVRS